MEALQFASSSILSILTEHPFLASAAALGGVCAASLAQRSKKLKFWSSQYDRLQQDAIESLGVPARGSFIDLPQLPSESSRPVRLNVVESVHEGEDDSTRPLVLLLHGFPESWFCWRHQFEPLVKAGFKVVAPDMRGYGQSSRFSSPADYKITELMSDVRRLLLHFGCPSTRRVNLVAHDWGAFIAWNISMAYPELLDRLAILNGPHPAAFRREFKTNPKQKKMSWYMAFFQIPWLPEVFLSMDPLSMASNVFMKTSSRPNAFDVLDLEHRTANMAIPGAMKSTIDYYRASFKYAKDAPKWKVIEEPVLLIWSDKDTALSMELTQNLDDHVKQLDLLVLKDCGHWSTSEAREEVNEALVKHLCDDSKLWRK